MLRSAATKKTVSRYHPTSRLDATDDCTLPEDLNYYYKIDFDNDLSGPFGGYDVTSDDNPYAYPGNGPNMASGNYPLGWHRIFWKVEDGCGNVTTCEYMLHIEDCKKPTPKCHNGLISVVMPSSGMVKICAEYYDAGSYDNCTPSEYLQFSFSDNSGRFLSDIYVRRLPE